MADFVGYGADNNFVVDNPYVNLNLNNTFLNSAILFCLKIYFKNYVASLRYYFNKKL